MIRRIFLILIVAALGCDFAIEGTALVRFTRTAIAEAKAKAAAVQQAKPAQQP